MCHISIGDGFHIYKEIEQLLGVALEFPRHVEHSEDVT
jgi:hypothetical protein